MTNPSPEEPSPAAAPAVATLSPSDSPTAAAGATADVGGGGGSPNPTTNTPPTFSITREERERLAQSTLAPSTIGNRNTAKGLCNRLVGNSLVHHPTFESLSAGYLAGENLEIWFRQICSALLEFLIPKNSDDEFQPTRNNKNQFHDAGSLVKILENLLLCVRDAIAPHHPLLSIRGQSTPWFKELCKDFSAKWTRNYESKWKAKNPQACFKAKKCRPLYSCLPVNQPIFEPDDDFMEDRVAVSCWWNDSHVRNPGLAWMLA